MRNPVMTRATMAAIGETGVGVLDIEFVKITPEIDIATLEPFFAVGADLGARYVITAPYDPDLARLGDRLGAISELAANYGLGAVLEFFPWTVVLDFSSAVRVVEASGRSDAGVLVDALHFNPSKSALDELDRVPAYRLPFVHVCDAPVQESYATDELIHTGRAERLPPGKGRIDIKRLLTQMPPNIPIALEVPMTAMTAAQGAEAVALRVRKAASRLLAR